MPSFILIMQPFGHNTSTLQTDRQTGNGLIAQGEPCYKRSPKKWQTHQSEVKFIIPKAEKVLISQLYSKQIHNNLN